MIATPACICVFVILVLNMNEVKNDTRSPCLTNWHKLRSSVKKSKSCTMCHKLFEGNEYEKYCKKCHKVVWGKSKMEEQSVQILGDLRNK